MRYLFLALVLALSACGNVSGKPLPEVNKDDPIFALQPDRLNAGELPQ